MSSRMSRSNNSDSRIYVGNLPEDVKSNEVENIFSKFGRIVDVEVKAPKGTRRGPAFAFLQFEDPRDADDAIRARDGYEFDGQRLRVEVPAPRASRGGFSSGGFSGRGRGRGGRSGGPPPRSDYRVLLSGLPPSGSWQDIKDHMREAGEVVYADVFRDGTGIVEFARRKDMDWAVRNLDDTLFKSHEGESSRVRVKLDGNQRRSRSRSRSRSPRRSRSRSYSR